MATRAEQVRLAIAQSKATERLAMRELKKWGAAVAAKWIPGRRALTSGEVFLLSETLQGIYDYAAFQVLPFDYRQLKAYDDIIAVAANSISAVFAARLEEILGSIEDTVGRFMTTTEIAARAESWTTEEARVAFAQRWDNHRIIIGITESNWAVDGVKETVITTVPDPLSESLERIADLFEAGDAAGARRLAREVNRLARLPLSVSQGRIIGYVRGAIVDRLVTPEAQGRVIANLRRRAKETKSTGKQWRSMEDANVRPTHAEANGQVRAPEDPFSVGGALMQKPRDGTLGAPLSEIINCRCITVWL
jgi:hypothetical protein